MLENPSARSHRPRVWNIHTDDIFGSLCGFEDRLNSIRVCNTSLNIIEERDIYPYTDSLHHT